MDVDKYKDAFNDYKKIREVIKKLNYLLVKKGNIEDKQVRIYMRFQEGLLKHLFEIYEFSYQKDLYKIKELRDKFFNEFLKDF